VAGQPERPPEPDRAGERQHDDRDRRQDRDPAEAGDVDEAELQAEQDDAEAEQAARGELHPRREAAGERGLQRGHLADHDPEGHRSREDRHGRHGEVHEPCHERRGCRDGESRHPFAHRAHVAQAGVQKWSCRNSGVTGTAVQIG